MKGGAVAGNGLHISYSDGMLSWDYGKCQTEGRLSIDFTPYFGKWTHVALVSSGTLGTFKWLYLHGMEVQTRAAVGGSVSGVTGLDLGRMVSQ